MTEVDLKRWRSTVDAEGTTEDIEAFNRFADGNAQTSDASCASVNIKVEGQTEGAKMADEIENLKANLPAVIQRITPVELTCGAIQLQTAKDEDKIGKKHHNVLKEDCDNTAKQASKVVRILKRLLLETANDSELPKVVTLVNTVDADFVAITEWATRFGFGIASAKKAKLRKAAT
jgi:hypothetical protein